LPSFEWTRHRGKPRWITGASMGIGRGIAAALAREACKLAVAPAAATCSRELETELGRSW
jgi:short-subunit dehydrogenase